MIRHVALIYPAARRYSGFLSAQRMPGLVVTHAGLTILAQMLRREGIEAPVYDEQIAPFTPAMVEGADLVGISAMTPGARAAYALAARVRSLGVPVVLGGAHATIAPEEALDHAEYVVRGEGEHALVELVRALDGHGSLSDIAGLSYHTADGPRHNPERPLMTTAELDEVPWPRVELVEGFDRWRYPLDRSLYFTMLTRGCAQRCIYCSVIGVFGHALRHRSVPAILEELGSRWDPERQLLFFLDDSLGSDPDFLKSFLTALIEHDLVPRRGWHSQLRADTAGDPELLELMRATNCACVSCGFESPSPRNLRTLGKRQHPGDVRRWARRFRERGILLNGYFMLGADDDGDDVLSSTVAFARELGCTLAGFMPLTPYPNTPLWRKLEREGRIFTRDWELYDQQHVVIHPRTMSPWQLYWRTMACYPRFYGGQNPWRQARRLLPQWPAATLGAVAAVWPVMRQLVWAREVVANADYIQALWQESRAPGRRPFPDLSGRSLRWKDLYSGRTARGLLHSRRVNRRR